MGVLAVVVVLFFFLMQKNLPVLKARGYCQMQLQTKVDCNVNDVILALGEAKAI